MFQQGTNMIKTQVKFASDFHRDKKEKKKGQEVVISEKIEEEEIDENGLKQGHFVPIKTRINKVYKNILQIKSYQQYRKVQEELFEKNTASLSKSFFWMSIF